MALLFPNSVKVVISLNCGITWSNSSVCFLRGRKSCPLAGLWGGHELEKSPQYASLAGAGCQCDGNGCEVHGDVHAGLMLWSR